MNEDTIEVLLKIGSRFYEGKLTAKKTGSQVPSESKRPMLPEPYAEMVCITDMGSYWQIKPRTFLQSPDFAEIARIVKQYDGAYVSAGKSSHFRIPK